MKIWICTCHGSRREIEAVTKAGYVIRLGRMAADESVEGEPFEVAKKLHDAGKNTMKVAVGDFKPDNDGVVIMVSDDWFHQR